MASFLQLEQAKKPGVIMKNPISNQKGQGVLEYVILSGLIGIFCLVAIKSFGGVIKTRIEKMREHVTKNINIG